MTQLIPQVFSSFIKMAYLCLVRGGLAGGGVRVGRVLPGDDAEELCVVLPAAVVVLRPDVDQLLELPPVRHGRHLSEHVCV